MSAIKTLNLVCVALLAACAQPLADRFATIEAGVLNGTPRTRVMELLGPPASTRAASIAGAEAEWAEWRDGRGGRSAVYTVVFIQGRAVLKTVRPANTKEM